MSQKTVGDLNPKEFRSMVRPHYPTLIELDGTISIIGGFFRIDRSLDHFTSYSQSLLVDP
jgi:hypothetical protein